jgi:hypothetical protein
MLRTVREAQHRRWEALTLAQRKAWILIEKIVILTLFTAVVFNISLQDSLLILQP